MMSFKHAVMPIVLVTLILSACAGGPAATAPAIEAPDAAAPSAETIATDSNNLAATPPTAPATATAAPLPDPVPLELVDQGFSVAENDTVNYSFLVRNPNPSHAVQFSAFKTYFYDANNVELGTDEGSIELVLPGQTTGVGSGRWLDESAVASMKIELTSGEAVVMKETLPLYEIINTSECVLNGFPVVRAEINSPYTMNVILPRISVVYYDAEGKISGGGYGYRAGILANSRTGVVISGNKTGATTRYELYAGYRDLPGTAVLPADASPLTVSGQTFVQNGNNITYSVVIENPNASYLVNQSLLAVNAYAADGTFLSGEPLALINVLPGQKLGVSREIGLCEGDAVDHIEVAVSSGDFVSSQQAAYFTSENVSVQGGVVSGDLINQSGQEIKTVYATAIVYDENGQIIGGGSKTLDLLASDGRISVQIPVTINGTPASAEIFGVLTRNSLLK